MTALIKCYHAVVSALHNFSHERLYGVIYGSIKNSWVIDRKLLLFINNYKDFIETPFIEVIKYQIIHVSLYNSL